jgi:glycerol-3-phosphate dehydrogenase
MKEGNLMFDVFIIGAGVVGAMAARELSRYKLSVCVADKQSDVAMGATRANSAIIHAGFDAPEGSLKARLNVRGAKMMPGLAKELGVSYIKNGALVIGLNDGDKQEIKRLYERGINNGVEALAVLDKNALRTLEANISPDAVCALHAPSSAIICPYELTVAAIGNAMDNGAELLLNFNVEKIEPCDGGYEVTGSGGKYKTRCIINAAGLYSDEAAKLAGDESFHIRPRKGEYLLLDCECGLLVSHTVFRTPSGRGKGILISPTVDGNLILGPTSEVLDDKTDTATTPDGLKKIIGASSKMVKGISFDKVITSFAGLRAAGSTGDFIINMPKKGFINAAGIESPGLSASPAIAEYLISLAASSGIPLEKKACFNPIRKPMRFFRNLSMEEKNKVIHENSKYGKMVCRCEEVSEGEIIDAIHANPKATTLDGIKRRTRSGMGRCQGGFCLPSILEILSREMNVPMARVTKSGGGSYLVMPGTKGV